jgi:hypothetical protein
MSCCQTSVPKIFRTLSHDVKQRDYLRCLEEERRILKLIQNMQRVRKWTEFIRLKVSPVAGCCADGNESSVSVILGVLLAGFLHPVP